MTENTGNDKEYLTKAEFESQSKALVDTINKGQTDFQKQLLDQVVAKLEKPEDNTEEESEDTDTAEDTPPSFDTTTAEGFENSVKAHLDKITEIHDKQVAELKDSLTSKDQVIKDYHINTSLKSELVNAGIPPHFMDMLTNHMLSINEFSFDSSGVKVGDKSLRAFISEWAATDDAKHYIAATKNSGGGARNRNFGDNLPDGWDGEGINKVKVTDLKKGELNLENISKFPTRAELKAQAGVK